MWKCVCGGGDGEAGGGRAPSRRQGGTPEEHLPHNPHSSAGSQRASSYCVERRMYGLMAPALQAAFLCLQYNSACFKHFFFFFIYNSKAHHHAPFSFYLSWKSVVVGSRGLCHPNETDFISMNKVTGFTLKHWKRNCLYLVINSWEKCAMYLFLYI